MPTEQSIEQEEQEEIKLPDTKFLEMPAKFGSIPVPKMPWGAQNTPDPYEREYPHIRLPIQEVESFSFGNDDLPFNKLYWGDNLHIMRQLPKESIDLIYIDPPFFSGRNYNVIFGDNNEVRSFTDIWEGGMPGYLIWLNARLVQMKRLLKPTGSIYVHLDWHAAHYVKVEMDKIFGYENFRNEIIWKRSTGHPLSVKKLESVTDTILVYAKSENVFFSPVVQPLDDKVIQRDYKNKDEHGYYQNVDLTGGKGGGKEAYEPFNGTLPTKGRAWAPPRREKLPQWAAEKLPSDYEELDQLEKCKALDKIGLIYWSKTNNPRFKRYLPDNPTRFATNLWDDINVISSQSNERIGYPTQKPEELLQRIISSSSKPGDVVADFFVGGGTAVITAQRLGRQWIGCDQSRVAISVTIDRLLNRDTETEGTVQHSLGEIAGFKLNHWGNYFIPQLSKLSDSDFKKFIIECFNGEYVPTGKAIHGYHKGDRLPIFVGTRELSKLIRKTEVISFAKAVLENTHKHEGFILGWGFDSEAKAVAHELRKREGIRLDFVKLEMIKIGTDDYRDWVVKRNKDYDNFLQFIQPPVVKIRHKKISEYEYEFDAFESQSMNSGEKIVNVQWDFSYNDKRFRSTRGYSYNRENDAAVLIVKYKFPDSPHGKKIACRVQDSAGGEGFEVITL